MDAPLVLASASPRRVAALQSLGLEFEALAPSGDGPALGSDPALRVLAHARHKAETVARLRPGARVLAGDTLVYLDGEFFPKPADRAEAGRMLRSLSGRVHEVWTATVLRRPDGGESARSDRARVRFLTLPEPELERYLAGDEWRDKAGAYGIQGWAGRWCRLEEGALGTVVGFDPEAVRAVLAEAAGAR